MSSVKEISEAVEFVCALANAVGEAAEDGKITMGDAAHLIPLLYKLPSAVEGLSDVSFADLSLSDLEALNAKVKESLDLPADKVECAIEEAFDISLKLYNLVQNLRA
jgi:hypothetical protein